MIFGLYYNTPLIDGCRGSEMVRRFSQFMLERLGIEEQEAALLPGDRRLRVTIIARQTRFRKIVNEAELVSALQETGLYKVKCFNKSTVIINLHHCAPGDCGKVRPPDPVPLAGLHHGGDRYLGGDARGGPHPPPLPP